LSVKPLWHVLQMVDFIYHNGHNGGQIQNQKREGKR
jgi:hypothetical protein